MIAIITKFKTDNNGNISYDAVRTPIKEVIECDFPMRFAYAHFNDDDRSVCNHYPKLFVKHIISIDIKQ